MKEISLKQTRKETPEVAGPPKEYYPSFTLHDHSIHELMDIPIGKEVLAKIKKTSHEMHEGKEKTMSCGFDVMAIMLKDTKAMEKTMEDAKVPKERREAVMKKYMGEE